MSILIQGKMPTNGEVIVIKPNGQAILYADGDVAFLDDPRRIYKTIYKTIELPPHGRLIDADAFLARNAYFADREFVNPKYDDTLKDLVDAADTVIPADPEGGGSGNV